MQIDKYQIMIIIALHHERSIVRRFAASASLCQNTGREMAEEINNGEIKKEMQKLFVFLKWRLHLIYLLRVKNGHTAHLKQEGCKNVANNFSKSAPALLMYNFKVLLFYLSISFDTFPLHLKRQNTFSLFFFFYLTALVTSQLRN